MSSIQAIGNLLAIIFLVLVGGAVSSAGETAQYSNEVFSTEVVADLDEPWAMAVMSDGRLLVTEKAGQLKLVTPDGSVGEIAGIPEVSYGGQGGLGDVVLAPDFDTSGTVYLSYVESDGDNSGAVVSRGRLVLADDGGELQQTEVIWRQTPKVSGEGHYGHRLAFDPEGKLWISSGDRQKFEPAQDMEGNLGKILRLNPDGTVPADNPYAERGGVTAQIWSSGHRNPLGLAFDSKGQLWVAEMGPAGGDELNLVRRGANYGYPIVSDGDHYSGQEIPDHATAPQFDAPAIFWTPVISPSSLMFYSGERFPQWQGNALIGGLSAEGLVRIEFDGESAKEAERYPLDARIRSVAQAADGTVWVLEDEKRGSEGRLLRLQPVSN